jgi:hypothetical protein
VMIHTTSVLYSAEASPFNGEVRYFFFLIVPSA